MSNKLKEIEGTIKNIEKQFGKGAIMKLGGEVEYKYEVIPSGSIYLDECLGVGGYPRGRIIEIFGPESSGKTTLTLHAIAEIQKKGGLAAFIDAEHALDPGYAKNLGVDIDNLIVSQPDSGEQALEITETLVRSGNIDLIVIDSVAALVPEAELNGEMGASHVGLQARLMSQAMRKLSGILSKSNSTAIFINQLREKVGVMFGNPEVTPGGRALKFYATQRVEVRKGEQIKNGADVIGNKTKVKVVKNKVAPPFKACELEISYGTGISALAELIDLATERDIINKSGSWYSYKGEKLGQGRENVKVTLKDDGKLLELIKKDLFGGQKEKSNKKNEIKVDKHLVVDEKI